jgi:hypothetical protein
MTKAGTKMPVIMKRIMNLFKELGYPEDQICHFHGGIQHYGLNSARKNLDPATVITPNTAYAWYITIAGVKAEETLLLDEEESLISTFDQDFPFKEIKVDNEIMKVNDILIRS